jgi:CRISPR-associated protein Csm1
VTHAFTQWEAVIGGLLHDIGKFMQRAHGSVTDLPEASRQMEGVLCPTNSFGRHTHKHVLWTDAFFEWMERQGIGFPRGINASIVRSFANIHHLPDSPRNAAMGWLSAKADRYSSGMDRKPGQEEQDTGEAGGWDAFKKTPLRCIFDEIDLGLGKPGVHSHALMELEDGILPRTGSGQDAAMPKAYLELWRNFCKEFERAAKQELTPRMFEEILLGLLERHAWAIPSSTTDIPDISLYDHSRTTAAIAACLHRFHHAEDTLDHEAAIKDDDRPKFRFIAGDLSGIQTTLFTLQSQGVKGVNKILRARSFLLGAITEAAAHRLLTALDLPLSCLVQLAGGRLLILAPHVPDLEERIAALRGEFDRWLLENYTGSLALNLAVGTPFSGKDFRSGRFASVTADIGSAVDTAKQQPLATAIGRSVLELSYPHGPCGACGVRPALGGDRYCPACERERRIGAELPRVQYLAWSAKPLHGKAVGIDLFGLELALLQEEPESSARVNLVSLRAVGERPGGFPWSRRYLANAVAVWREDHENLNPIYRGFEEDQEETARGKPKSFLRLSALAREEHPRNSGEFLGKPFLAVLKADVDRLGFVFSRGLKREGARDDRATLSRFAQLSRMLDFYFTGWLQGLIRREFPDTYTVYAGGDDLLLIGPWRQMLELARRIEESFRAYTGDNPSITLSAGIELIHANQPINRAVEGADERLERAKSAGRNRVCAIVDEPLGWREFAEMLAQGEWFNQQMRLSENAVPTSFVYRLLELTDEAASKELRHAGWRAKLAYHLARNVKKERRGEWLQQMGFDQQLQGGENMRQLRLPLSIALYRNRT